MKPFRSRLARALVLAFLLLFSLQVGVALADDPVVTDPTAVPTEPVAAPAVPPDPVAAPAPDPVAPPTTVPEDPGFVPPAVPENPTPTVPTTPEDPGFGG